MSFSVVFSTNGTVHEIQAGRETGCAMLPSKSLEGKSRGRALGIAYWASSAVSVTLKGLFGRHSPPPKAETSEKGGLAGSACSVAVWY